MSTDEATKPQVKMKETERIVQGPGPGRGPFGGGMVGQKANTFKPSAKRLIGTMRPERFKVYLILILALGSVVLMSFGPKILGDATDHILGGILGRAQAHGAHIPDKLSKSTHLTNGVDFNAVGNILLLALTVYLVSSLLSWLQGYVLNDVVQAAISRMRGEVEDKVNRLPLGYFDSQPRGELLSRVTNDIDNVSQTLQQTMSQLLTSLLSVFAVLAMMVWISPLLAVIALVTVPLSIIVTKQVMSRSQGRFIEQWRRTGRVNA
ncbi:MAG TPA: ABC transporter ATP-binding protein, partial [Marmoricola sp.]|nr:ABC transporter ATP-binding protein [Marmoricola sp.]